MLGFPKETEFNRVVPKNKFYEKADISPSLKASFVDDIEKIIWTNKLSPDRLNIGTGSNIEEIEVFHILLKNKDFNQKILEAIDKAIPYYILFVIEYKGKQQVWLGYKEKTNENKVVVSRYFNTNWLKTTNLEIQGNKIDNIYSNFLNQVSGGLIDLEQGQDVKEQVDKTIEIEKLEQEIAKLTKKMLVEKQFNRQIEINKEIKKLTKTLEGLKNGKNGYGNKE